MALQNGFVYLSNVDNSIIQDIRYFTKNNFIGKPITGYAAAQCMLTWQAAQALAEVQQQLKQQGLGLKVFDCYRPQRAVNEFIAWSRDYSDQKMKQQYYPHINKEDVFKLGYVAMRSGHTRGSTIDLTLVKLKNKQEINMGTHFDFLDETSHPLASDISQSAQQNRLYLQKVMEENGFAPLDTEWWHFTLKNEPYPDTYFDFIVL